MVNEKESLIFIINLSVSSESPQDNSFLLDKAKTITQRIIEKRIFLRLKDEIGIILIGTKNTRNKLDYKNIVVNHMQVPNWKLIRTIIKLQHTNCPSNWIEGLYVAIDYIKHECIGNNIKKLVLFSDFKEVSNMQTLDVDNIVQALKKQKIELVAIGSKSLVEKPGNFITSSEKIFINICKQVNGTYKTINKALNDLLFISKAQSMSTGTSFKLEILDLEIPIKTYTKCEQRLPPWKYETDKTSPNEEIKPKNPVQVERKRVLLDRYREEHKSDKTVEGYMYGGVPVIFKDKDEKAMLYESGPSSYKFLYFTKEKHVGIEYWCTSTSTCLVFPANKTVAPLFYNLLQAMKNKHVVAIIRKVCRKNCVPNIVALFPRINIPDEPWCFVEIKLPFAEDVRIVETKSLTSFVKRLSKEQNEIIDNYLDSFMQSTIGDDSEKKKKKEFMPGCIPNPVKQHTYNVLSYRALNSEESNSSLPPVDNKIKRLLEPDQWMIEKLEGPIKGIKSLFDLNENVASDVITSNPEDKLEQSSDLSKDNNPGMDIESSEEPVLLLDTSDIDMDEWVANI